MTDHNNYTDRYTDPSPAFIMPGLDGFVFDMGLWLRDANGLATPASEVFLTMIQDLNGIIGAGPQEEMPALAVAAAIMARDAVINMKDALEKPGYKQRFPFMLLYDNPAHRMADIMLSSQLGMSENHAVSEETYYYVGSIIVKRTPKLCDYDTESEIEKRFCHLNGTIQQVDYSVIQWGE